MSVHIYSLFRQTEEERKSCFGGELSVGFRPRALGNRGDDKILSFFKKFKIISPLLCYLLGSLTNKYIRAWSSMTNFMDRFQDLSEESCCHQKEDLTRSNSYLCAKQ